MRRFKKEHISTYDKLKRRKKDLKKICMKVIRKNMKSNGLNKNILLDRAEWRTITCLIDPS